MSDPDPVYLITVAAQGATSGFSVKVDDLMDAVVEVKKFQGYGLHSISINFQKPHDWPQGWESPTNA